MTNRENYLRAMDFRTPQWIPCRVGLSFATWHKYREELEELVLRHPLIFDEYKKGSVSFDEFPPCYRKEEYYRDNWDCLWYSNQAGLEGQVVEHPLADWTALDTYEMPDFLLKSERGERDWTKIEEDIEERKRKGLLTVGNGERLFDRLYFLRGFENLMIDLATDAPELPRLIEMLCDYEIRLVRKWLQIGVDVVSFHTDIGTQKSLMISAEKFRQYIKPMLKEIFTTCRKAETRVALSSDGCLLEIVDDLIECGVSMHDPQLRANTLESIKKDYKGKMCINLDLDRQMFPFCLPEEIKIQVKQVVEELDSFKGGLMLMGNINGADVPLENIQALCKAMEEYAFENRKVG